MRLSIIFLIGSMLNVTAASMAQQVTFKKNNVTLSQLFKEIRKQTGYSVIWGSEEFNANERMSVDFDHSNLKEVFDKVVAAKDYSYLIDEKTIIIQKLFPKPQIFPEPQKL
ncbi:STN domain-containing protein [Pedobacter sp. P26]|uniref:STN domain-containing protein n=1 Tax=Pedobacter sp. P26 TaxID=3423956 RepID=UPI003D67CF54